MRQVIIQNQITNQEYSSLLLHYMTFKHIAGYKFIPLENLPELRSEFLEQCNRLNLRGTILLSVEGINIALSGMNYDIMAFQLFLNENIYFSDIIFNESQCASQVFKRLKVKI